MHLLKIFIRCSREFYEFVTKFQMMTIIIPDKFGVRRISQNLLFAKQEIIPNQKCAESYKHQANNLDLITPDVICTNNIDMKSDHCIGDAGSPLIINEQGKNILVGFSGHIHSEGSCDPRYPTTFERITSHYDWIGRVTGYQFRL